ncbi:unnamed protein product, partial [Mesorhabditis spiculigera]
MPLSHVAKVLRLSTETMDEIVEVACRILSSGGVVALPTDTLYGVTTVLEHTDKLYALKKRTADKPLGIFVPSATDVSRVAECSTVEVSLLRSLLPGPVTLIFDRGNALPVKFNPGVHAVGVRVPNSRFVQALTRRIGVPLAQTSANISGGPSPVQISDFEELFPEIDLVVDGGLIGDGKEAVGSTIVDLSRKGFYHIIREGCALLETSELLHQAGLKETDIDEIMALRNTSKI